MVLFNLAIRTQKKEFAEKHCLQEFGCVIYYKRQNNLFEVHYFYV